MDEIYKYTSLDSAIKIIKSNKVLLNNPSKYNKETAKKNKKEITIICNS